MVIVSGVARGEQSRRHGTFDVALELNREIHQHCCFDSIDNDWNSEVSQRWPRPLYQCHSLARPARLPYSLTEYNMVASDTSAKRG